MLLESVMRRRRISGRLLAFALVALAPAPALAQQASEAMSCAAAVAYFEANGVIYKRVQGSVLPIRRGVPVAQSRGMSCGRGQGRTRYWVPTLDNPRCVVSVYCG